jgi:hypothetical protein
MGQSFMKTAMNRAGEPIEAEGATEDRAVCPYCGGEVALRRRRLMGGRWVAYWRHPDNGNLSCPGRSGRVVGETGKKNPAASPQRVDK